MKYLGRLFSILLALPSLFFCSGSSAQEAIIRTSLGAKENPYVGQKTVLVVELLVPGFFSGSPVFALPEATGLLLVPPSESPVIGNEDQNGVSYTVQRHEVAVFAAHSGEQVIPSFNARFAYKRQPLDKDPIPVVLKTEPIRFKVELPPGAEKLGNVISARDLKVEESWKPDPGKAKVGDAFVRTIVYSASDVPGMMFPPFPNSPVDGLGIYTQQPEVLDKSERGEQEGERRDRFTYVCKRAGRYTIPAAQLTWWNLDGKKLDTIQFPARTLEVSLNPAFSTSKEAPALSPASKRGIHPWLLLGLFTALFSLVIFLILLLSGALTFLRPVHLAPLNPAAWPNK